MCMNNEGSWRGVKRDGKPCRLIGLSASFPPFPYPPEHRLYKGGPLSELKPPL